LEKVVDFYKIGLGLEVLGEFKNHDGFTGIMLGKPTETYHFEFTEHVDGSPCPAPTKDNLLVFYFDGREQRDFIAQRIFDLGYSEVEPENPYWKINGITIEDPDKWRIVLMKTPGFNVK
jgi:catechol 2,3-dioxygenase-like lactoylglutathione lyase family enzyme